MNNSRANLIQFVAMPTELMLAYQAGAADANGQPPERYDASPGQLPCRHCMKMIEQGEPYLALAYRPFPSLQPYAEVGPIFLHADGCERGGDAATPTNSEQVEIPHFLDSPSYIVRGYTAKDRIYYGSGGVVPTDQIPTRASELFANDKIAYIHVRSVSNNCYHCRIDRA